jgi:hypothetical protein
VLTKQLAVFSLPALGIMWLVCVCRLSRLVTPAALSVTIGAVTLVFIVFDQLFPTPPGYYGSGLLYVFMRGSNHASTVHAMGTSLFALLPIPGHAPSTWAYPIFTLGGVTAKVIPLYFGLSAFFTTVFVMTFFGALVVKRLCPLNPREVLLMTLAVAAVTNLFMNTFLAGTHERYLYHYGFFLYPLLLSLIRSSFFSNALLALCLMHLCVYGYFVFKVFIFDLESPVTKYAQQTVALANVVSSFVALWLVTKAARRRAPKGLT